MPRVIKKRVAKGARPEVGVKDIAGSARKFALKNQKVVLPLLVLSALSVFAAAGFYFYSSNARIKAEALEYDAYKAYYGLYQKQSVPGEERYRTALDKFQKAYDARKSPLVLFYIAGSYYEMGKYDEALKSLKELNERFPDDERYVPLSYYRMAVINSVKGDNEAALRMLDTLYNYKTASFKDLALAESARLLNAMGRTAESQKKYGELIQKFPASPFAAEANARGAQKKN